MASKDTKAKTAVKADLHTTHRDTTEAVIGHGGMGANRTKRRGAAFGALCLFLVFVVGTTVIVERMTQPDSATLVKVSTPTLATVTITDEGFSPATLSIKKGTVVMWKGTQTINPVIIASNPYPKNDSLKSLASAQISYGANYRYKFINPGTYQYHDDLNPSINGTIEVKQ